MSNLNQKISKMRHQKKQEAEKRYIEERDREIIKSVLDNLGKKDPLQERWEDYEKSLHITDHLNLSPSDKDFKVSQLLSVQDTKSDTYSKAYTEPAKGEKKSVTTN